MTVRFADIASCFEGVIPSMIATVSADGTPNISYLSHVHLVSDTHVALSNQFFSKTSANVRENPRVLALIVDPLLGTQYALDIRFERSETTGDLFSLMAARIEAIAAHSGKSGVMRLRSADVYRVLSISAVPRTALSPMEAPDDKRIHNLAEAALLADTIADDLDAECLIDGVLNALGDRFGFEHGMVLLRDASTARLTTVASRGYGWTGAGSEVGWGDGVIGMAAAERRPIRVNDTSRIQRFTDAVAGQAEGDLSRTIPWPGLADPQSQLAVPMTVRGVVQGVIFVEASERLAFAAEDEAALRLIAHQLAANLALAEAEAGETGHSHTSGERTALGSTDPGTTIDVRYHAFDDSLFIDRDYLIKGVPGRILWTMLRELADEGRTDFTNRELRLNPYLRLPEFKDNLETRLILLRRRLEEKRAPIRLERIARGQLRLVTDGSLRLTKLDESVPEASQ